MIRAFKNIALYAALFFLILWVLQYITDQGLRKSKMQNYAVWNDVYGGRINADLLICGNSRTKLFVSPAILDSVLGVNSYNVGINGGYLPILNAMFKIYLQHNKKPRYIVQNVDFALFTNGPHLSDCDQYLPFLQDTIITNVAAQYEEKFTFPEIYLPLFKYNNHLNLIKEGIFCYFNFGHRGFNSLYKGFGGRNITFDDFFELRFKKESELLRNSVEKTMDDQFAAYLDYCKANDIKLVFYYAPMLQPVSRFMQPDTSAITRRIIYYATKYNIPYLSYLNDSLCSRPELFSDHVHLNGEGARLFSLKLAADLKNIISK